MIRARPRVDDRAVRAALRDARRDAQRIANEEIARISEERVLPLARQLTPRIVRDGTVLRVSAAGRPYLTTRGRGMRRRIFAYLNWGGTIRGEFGPRRRGGRGPRALAIRTPQGVIYRARVRRPRHFEGKHFLERAASGSRRSVTRALARELPRALQARIDRRSRILG